MPALASHRKPRSRTTRTFGTHSPAVGVTTAALASVTTLLSSQSAGASVPVQPTVEEVQRKVDDLYRQAGNTATQQYTKANEATDRQRRTVDGIFDGAAGRAQAVNETRRALGDHTAAPSRPGTAGTAGASRASGTAGAPGTPGTPGTPRTIGPAAALVFADDPRSFTDRTQVRDRIAEQRHQAFTDLPTQRVAAAELRVEAAKGSESLAASPASLRSSKQAVQRKLAEARALLSQLTAEERARPEVPTQREAEAGTGEQTQVRAVVEAACGPRQREAREQEQRGRREARPPGEGGHDGASTTKADKVVAFARAQIGKPYVRGATGPSSYDCSGLTQAAWKAAGVDLPRTTWEQAEVGTRVPTDELRRGDLVFFHDDSSHVGIYQGDGMMIHASKPGTNVREESIFFMPIHGVVRPA
ncbi:NlpC/P60 family protein [Streptomyces sp. NPDC006368]|uniref:C40 family peptidase n=1 Tax=Streptomyces sp. NPDC006368 TaxID=3156760 RepID=UPI0033A89529